MRKVLIKVIYNYKNVEYYLTCKFYTILLSTKYNEAFVNVLNKLLNY